MGQDCRNHVSSFFPQFQLLKSGAVGTGAGSQSRSACIDKPFKFVQKSAEKTRGCRSSVLVLE